MRPGPETRPKYKQLFVFLTISEYRNENMNADSYPRRGRRRRDAGTPSLSTAVHGSVVFEHEREAMSNAEGVYALCSDLNAL